MLDELPSPSIAANPTSRRRSAGLRLAALIVLLAGALLNAQGCQSNYENYDWVDWRELNFGGYAENPSATIQIQAFDQSTSTWRVVAVATASGTPTTFGGQTLYFWSRSNFDFTTVPNWSCYWSYNGWCSIPAGYAAAQFRFKEVGSQLDYMSTYDQGGVACVTKKVLYENADWFSAGLQCASPDSPVLTLRVLT
ncbi:MAG: hypothetical protein R6X02_29980 [Enhygromyxa sp.]